MEPIGYVILGIVAGALSYRGIQGWKWADGVIGTLQGILLAATGNWSVPATVTAEMSVFMARGEKLSLGDKILTGTTAFFAAIFPKNVQGLALVAAALLDGAVGIPIAQIATAATLAAVGYSWAATLAAYRATRWVIGKVTRGGAQPQR